MNQKMKKVLKIFCIISVLILLVGLLFPTWTPSIKGCDNYINALEHIEINGTGHEIMIRGTNRENPVIIFVHGGPGCPEIPYVTKYQELLEQNFTVVQYDQRGSGKSYHFFEDYSNLPADLLVDDLLVLTDYISERLDTKKVILIGHSFGTYIGIRAAYKAPEKYIAYIGIGQMADTMQSELDSLEYCLRQAIKENNQKDIEQLESYRESIKNKEKLVPRSYVRKYGGASRLIDDNKDYLTGFLFHPEYNLLDAIRFQLGVSVSQEVLIDEILKNYTTSVVNELKIPCFFVSGRYDYMTSMNSAKQYLQFIQAPKKKLVVFEKSAHYPQFEEKEKFANWMNETWNELNK